MVLIKRARATALFLYFLFLYRSPQRCNIFVKVVEIVHGQECDAGNFPGTHQVVQISFAVIGAYFARATSVQRRGVVFIRALGDIQFFMFPVRNTAPF